MSKDILKIRFDKEAQCWVGRIELPIIFSQGTTEEEAKVATIDAVKLYLKHLFTSKRKG